jgi:predicted dehydrogenase
MRFGVFHLLWAMPLSDIPAVAARARAAGADVLELALSREPLPFEAEDQAAPDSVWPRKDFGNDNFGPSFRASVDAFCAALREGGRPLVDGDDALAELAIEAAIHRSSETGVPVRVPSL